GRCFVDSFLLKRLPWKLLLVSTGNISNRELDELFAANLSAIVDGFSIYDFIEINRVNVIFHCRVCDKIGRTTGIPRRSRVQKEYAALQEQSWLKGEPNRTMSTTF